MGGRWRFGCGVATGAGSVLNPVNARAGDTVALRRLAGGARTVMTATNQMSSMSASGPSLTASSVGHTRVVVVGATGMVGGYALRGGRALSRWKFPEAGAIP
jgi:hypothetical protein